MKACLPLLVAVVAASAADYPQAVITNGKVRAVLNLPNAADGYYRGTRFDWSGVIASLEYARHSYFGVWFPRYDPLLHDAITGPVEEFRSEDGALGYAAAPVGDDFVKIGVGVLRKESDAPYNFSHTYKAVSTGKWLINPEPDRVRFQQQLSGGGYAYVYTKTVRLVRGRPELVLEHSLKNTGKRSIVTDVYDHDFYVLDGQPTGPAVKVKFQFGPKPGGEGLGDALRISGNQLGYRRVLNEDREDVAAGYVTGYGTTAADNNISVENEKSGAGVQQIGDRPLSKLYFWSIRTTVCPEAYIHLDIPPKKTARWRIVYRFYELGK